MGLTVNSTYADFQAYFYNAGMHTCPRPCLPKEELTFTRVGWLQAYSREESVSGQISKVQTHHDPSMLIRLIHTCLHIAPEPGEI